MSRGGLLGIDIGTSGCKTVLIDLSGKVVAQASAPYAPRYPKPGWAEQDPEDWYQATISAVRAVLDKPAAEAARILAIGVTGQMISSVFVNNVGYPLRPAILWMDQRSIAQTRWLDEKYGDLICKITKTPINTAYTLPRILWVRQEEPWLWEKTHKVLLAKDYIRLCMTGEYATDFSDASGTLLLNSEQRSWSREILDAVGLKQSLLPLLTPSHEPTSLLSANAAKTLGLEEGVPVVTGAGDLFSENLSAGNVSEGQRLIRFGSCGSISSPLARPVQDPNQKCPCYVHCIPHRWLLETSTQAFGLSDSWFKEKFCQEEVEEAKQQGKAMHEIVDKMVSSVPPGANDLYFHPFIQGAPYWDLFLRGGFIGITANHGKAHFARAVLEGATYSLRDALDLLEQAESTEGNSLIHEWRAIGGGVRSASWRQIVADVLGINLLFLEEANPSSGAAMLAGIGIGVFESFEEAIRNCSASPQRIDMNPESHASYLKLYDRYKAVHAGLGQLYRCLEASGEGKS